MPAFSPYSGKYIGYTIEKGKLSIDVHYHVEKGNLTAENNVFLDQLTFGEKIESPDALAIPVTLAVGAVKRPPRRNQSSSAGKRLPSMILNSASVLSWSALSSICSPKAVTAPFSLLGSACWRG